MSPQSTAWWIAVRFCNLLLAGSDLLAFLTLAEPSPSTDGSDGRAILGEPMAPPATLQRGLNLGLADGIGNVSLCCGVRC